MPRSMTEPAPGVRPMIRAVATEMGRRLDDSASAVSDAIHLRVAELGDELYPSTRRSTKANLGLITSMLERDGDPSRFTAPEEALAYAREYVHAGLDLDCLTRAYQEGEHAYLREWVRCLRDRADDTEQFAEAMEFFSDWLFTYIGTIHAPLRLAYVAEHGTRTQGEAARRADEVRAVLSGGHVNVAEASARLRYRLEGRHVGFMVWDAATGAESQPALGARLLRDMEVLAAHVVEQAGATSSLVVPVGRAVAGWMSAAEAPEVASLPHGSDGLRVAVGGAGRALEGFRRTHHEAQEARRIASLAARPGRSAVAFDAIALDALLTQDLDEARRFVTAELGPLLDEDSDANRRLLATLEVYLQEESSHTRASRRLSIHQNTVAYRIRRVEEVLGRSVGVRHLELRAALRLSHLVRTST